MKLRNNNQYVFLIFLTMVSCFSKKVKEKHGDANQSKDSKIQRLDSFFGSYLQVSNVDTILSESISEIEGSKFFNKRFISKDLIYYYGRLISDGYYDDHMKNIISTNRKELWGTLYEFESYEVYELDSNRIFHEVKIDNILIGYYLYNCKPNKLVEKSFKRFLKDEFNYISECMFPSRNYE